MTDFWRGSVDRFDQMRGENDDTGAYGIGWTISGLAMLGAIVAVWVFGF